MKQPRIKLPANPYDAEAALGSALTDGTGVRKDLKEGLKWLRRAARHGSPQAQTDLGVCYHEGTGLKRNFKLAVKYYAQAASSGDEWAQYLLGLCYRDGEGVPADKKRAIHWFKKSAAQGGVDEDDEAREALKELTGKR